MTVPADNPWAARFAPLLDRNEIVRRATRTPAPLGDISKLTPKRARKELGKALESVYFPTAQGVGILLDWAGLAYQHCLDYYPSKSFYKSCIYSEESPLPEFSFPYCLTGQAGSGKTALIKTFGRIQQPACTIQIDPEHSPFPLESVWNITIHANATSKDVLSALSGGVGSPRDLVPICRRRAYRDGIAFLLEDEFQFATGSSSANARVTQMLLASAYIGLPSGIVANFSLLHRLMKRPSEDRQRLLSNPIVFLPEEAGSEDWRKTLDAQKAAAPDILVFDSKEDGATIHRYSAGDMRAEGALLLCAYEIGRASSGVVGLREIAAAYHSTEYAAYRHDVEAITQISLGDRKMRKQRPDLWCPLDLPADATARFATRVSEERQKRADDQATRDSLTAEEQAALAAKEKANQPKKQEKSAQVVHLKKKGPPTAEELKANMAKFRDRL
ncbi:MAG: hypothetical protein Q8M11_06395 [Sulfuritalea sp.]|nr:hypothetical protein [Sulfuritalea sp.]MDP1982124.1 hypothetical protein [Sulfuritalea sp.]